MGAMGEHQVVRDGGIGHLRMITRVSTVQRMRTVLTRVGAVLVVAALAGGLAACGDDDARGASGPAVVVTSNILGDVVRHLVGEDVPVEVLMPPNASPHDFAASARQATEMRDAELLVVNGLGFEAGLQDTIDAAADDGVPVVALAELAPDRLQLDGEDDPHVFTDPARMAVATAALADELAARLDALDTAAFRARAAAYVAELEALDAEVEEILSVVPAERRLLVTNHEVFGYFADRYGFEVLGDDHPGSRARWPSRAPRRCRTSRRRSAAAGVPAVFAETSSPKRLADALAAEGTDVEVVELYSESLGADGSGAATYIEMLRTDAQRIAAALG